MGMLIYDALVLTRVAAGAARRGNALSLGVPTLNFSEKSYRDAAKKAGIVCPPDTFSDHAEFFRMLGYEQVDALDISDYEGATITGDLNDPGLANAIGRGYDLIYDCGTLEHIFDAPTALRTIDTLTNTGGIVVHATPANGFMDHGFWQVSPDLFRSFYRARGFTVLTSALFVLGRQPVALPAEQNLYRNRGRQFIVENAPEAIAVFAARKVQQSEATAVQLQDYYGQMHQGHAGKISAEFFIGYGSPLRARIARQKVAGMLLGILQKIRTILRGRA